MNRVRLFTVLLLTALLSFLVACENPENTKVVTKPSGKKEKPKEEDSKKKSDDLKEASEKNQACLTEDFCIQILEAAADLDSVEEVVGLDGEALTVFDINTTILVQDKDEESSLEFKNQVIPRSYLEGVLGTTVEADSVRLVSYAYEYFIGGLRGANLLIQVFDIEQKADELPLANLYFHLPFDKEGNGKARFRAMELDDKVRSIEQISKELAVDEKVDGEETDGDETLEEEEDTTLEPEVVSL